MPQLTPVEKQRSHHLSSLRQRRSLLLSPSHPISKKITNIDTSGWEMCDDYRTDAFSENYYRHYHGLHKGGMVLATFVGMVLVVSGAVGAAFVG
mmetsp:Transcript_27530/g.58158  ORF Transcript_27530/g.58158 Transcript_27530/m.58158 type:complete len:94 (-) Transcript_27530:448-729(-)